MPYVTEFTTFAVLPGKEERASEWLQTLQRRQAECVETLDREHMHFESIFRHGADGRLYLSWLSVKGEAGAPVGDSPLDIDLVHVGFWRECIDPSFEPLRHAHVVSFLPASVDTAIALREASLDARGRD